MERNKLNQKGFTMIEMLLVLSIVIVVSSSVLLLTSTKMKEMEEERFYRQLHLDIQRLQAISITDYRYTHLTFPANRTKYQGKIADKLLFEKELPKHMRLSVDSTLKGIAFHPGGNVNDFGNFLFETDKGEKRITIYIGRGVVNYEK
ncbi:competence type IV pilus minor pilin ComGD [Psychrobacillus psychrodurans]|uniref:competence type IV pilus minor pilin ComGD n=1 Tax=Psychrobacillus psychrodurans TaxID=126157 RepID=UPI0022B957A4|nr:competence type IV pilus minor pilin ComGD [Psychrobacillus psychrodurans]